MDTLQRSGQGFGRMHRRSTWLVCKKNKRQDRIQELGDNLMVKSTFEKESTKWRKGLGKQDGNISKIGSSKNSRKR